LAAFTTHAQREDEEEEDRGLALRIDRSCSWGGQERRLQQQQQQQQTEKKKLSEVYRI
jgi:hypothetical protein